MPFAEIAEPNGVFTRTFSVPLKFPATTDIKVSAYTDIGTAGIETSYRGWTEK
jgi:hypothetical protein